MTDLSAVRVDIALALFNGQPWLVDFLESIARQSHRNWRMVVADDGSEDDSVATVRQFFWERPQQLLIVARKRERTGAAGAFADALSMCTAEFIVLADQDDIWLAEKIERLLVACLAHGSDRPCLAYSDMKVVDDKLNLIDESWWHYSRTHPDWSLSVRHTICQNTVPGCAMMLNRALLQRSMPIPVEAAMHDWWILLVALASGKVSVVTEPLVLYRRHATAHTFEPQGGIRSALKRLLFQHGKLTAEYTKSIAQATVFLDRFAVALNSRERKAVLTYVSSGDAGWLRRRYLLLKGRIRKSTFLGSARFYASL